MRPLVIAFLLGAVATGVAAGAAAVAIAIAADAAGWGGFRVALGPVLVLAFEREREVTEAGFGPGLALIALAGGCLNTVGAWLLRRRVRLD